jgi:hypothetical protein
VNRAPVYVRCAHARPQRAPTQRRLGVQQRRLRGPGVRAQPPARADRHLLQRGLQRAHSLNRVRPLHSNQVGRVQLI